MHTTQIHLVYKITVSGKAKIIEGQKISLLERDIDQVLETMCGTIREVLLSQEKVTITITREDDTLTASESAVCETD